MNTQNSMAVNLIQQRGNRCTATLLSWMEDNIKEDLPDGLWPALRREVMDDINEFKDLAIDVVKSDAAMINEVYMDQVRQIHDWMRRHG